MNGGHTNTEAGQDTFLHQVIMVVLGCIGDADADADGGDIGDEYQELYDTIIHIHSSIMPWRMKRTTKSIR